MIRAIIFDLDGELVKMERLIALSYDRSAVELCPYDCTEDEVGESFKDVVSRSRRAVAEVLIDII